jgi:hypothetical protein
VLTNGSPGAVAVGETNAHHHSSSAGSFEDDPPVMKATSYPGDEWIPRWDGD